MVSFPHCKINLGLNVVRKRPDGYHDLVTCFYPLPVTEVLEIVPANEFRFTSSGNEIPGEVDSNLCVKAFRRFRQRHNIPDVRMHLHKTIPTGAGLGGGSSDAAFTLKILNDLFELKLTNEQLAEDAATLGSDCPFFVYQQPMIGRGRGDELTPAPVNLSGKFFALVKPAVHIPTASAYADLVPSGREHDLFGLLSRHEVAEWRHFLTNDFEESVFRKFPEVGRIKARLYERGALYASMTGSGSAVYAIFSSPVDEVQKDFPGMYVAHGNFG